MANAIKMENDKEIKMENKNNDNNQVMTIYNVVKLKTENNGNIENKVDDTVPMAISATWKIKGFPQFYKSGHVTNIMILLNLDVVDVFKKTPNLTAYVRFKSVEEKLRAESIINGYTGKKIKRLHCIEHPDRKQYENDLAKALKRAKKRQLQKNDDSSQKRKPTEREQPPQPTSIHQVVTPLYEKSYEDQLTIKRQKICKDMGRFRRKMTNPRFMNQDFLTWLPSVRGAKNLKNLCPVLGIIPSPITKAYRNKVSLTIGYNKKSNNLSIGFQLGRFEHGAASIESCQDCLHIDSISKRIATCTQKFVRAQLDQYKYDCFNKTNHNGVWRKLDVRISSRTKQFVVTLQVQNRQLTQEQYDVLKNDFVVCICNEAKLIKTQCDYSLNGISVLINNTVSTANNNECPIHVLYGDNFHYEIICGLKFRISATSFFQINTESAERLYATTAQWAVQSVRPRRNVVVIDICCGTGTIGLCIAKLCGENVKKVIGLELIEAAVRDARFNAELNNFENATFIAGKAEDTLQKALDEEVECDDYVVAILDPPRCGVHKDICQLLRMKSRIQRIIYVSCNSASCINDAHRLCQTPSKKTVGTPFKPIKAIGVDLFPHTEHVEMVMLLERCNESDIDWTKLSLQGKESHRKYLYAETQKDKMKMENSKNATDKQSMSVLGKRSREETEQIMECKEKEPPNKRLKTNHINDKKENDMDVDANDKNRNVNNSKKSNKICSFKMEAVINNEVKTITDHLLNDKWSVIYFYGYDFEKTSCRNLKYLNGKYCEFKSLNTQIIGISTDSHYAHLAFIESDLGSNFKICLASDLSTNVTKQFGVLENGYAKRQNCAFIISPHKSMEYFTEFPSNIESKTMAEQLLTTLKSLQSMQTTE